MLFIDLLHLKLNNINIKFICEGLHTSHIDSTNNYYFANNIIINIYYLTTKTIERDIKNLKS